MPLQRDFPDDYAALREEVKRLRFQVAAATVIESAAVVAATESVTIAANADSGWQSLSGPSLPITTAAGKIVVTASARIKIGSSNTNALAVMSWEIRDAANVLVVAADLQRGPFVEYKGAGMGASVQGTFSYVHTGLPAGSYTVKTQYRYWDGPGGVGGTWTADFINRSLIAKGY